MTTPARGGTTTSRPDLRAVRALAVVGVLVGHVGGMPVVATIAFDVFFALAGFTITDLLVREYRSRGRFRLSDFFTRRARRILPLSALVLVVSIVVAYAILPVDWAASVARDSGWAATGLANWHFALSGAAFDAVGQHASPVLNFWAIAVEGQLGIVWPVVVFVVMRGAVLTGRPVRIGVRRMIVAAIVLTVASAALAWWLGGAFATWTYGWLFGLGALIALVVPVMPVVPAMPVASPARVVSGRLRRLSVHPVATYVGDLSFGIYLWHFPVLVFLATVIRPGLRYAAVSVTLTLVLAFASYHLVEEPIRRFELLDRRARSRRRMQPLEAREHETSVLFRAISASDAVIVGCAIVAAIVVVIYTAAV